MTVLVKETPVTTLGWKVGLVSGRVLRAVADIGPGDDAFPAKGDIIFTPKVLESVIPGSPTVRVRSETITASLDAEGYISRNFSRGVWLWAGFWTVNATSVGAGTFEILVTEKNDKDHPLDLWSYSAVPPAPGVTQYTLTLPAGGVAFSYDANDMLTESVNIPDNDVFRHVFSTFEFDSHGKHMKSAFFGTIRQSKTATEDAMRLTIKNPGSGEYSYMKTGVFY